MGKLPRLLTTGELAKQCGVTVKRIDYLVQSRRIEAIGRAGIAKVYSQAQLEYIRAELVRMHPTSEAKDSAGAEAPVTG